MTNNPSFSKRRQRGVILSFKGWQRLQAAEQIAAQQDNQGYPYTLEQLSLLTGLSTNTLTKVRRRQKPVDLSTLDIYFANFELILTASDYGAPDVARGASPQGSLLTDMPFSGPLAFNNPYYVYRQPIEESCFREILLPSALVRIKAPRKFGKTSLMTLLKEYGSSQNLQAVVIHLELLDQRFLQSTDGFMQWFCASVARSLGMPNQLDQRWDEQFGGSYSCTEYFETYLLVASERPLLLLIDSVDQLFAHPEIAIDFFSMLRAWYEQGRYEARNVWQKLRLVLSHSMDASQTFSAHRSPFNVGVSIVLPPLNLMQIQSLAFRYGLEPSGKYAEALSVWLGGHPYLVQMSLFHLSQSQQSLEELMDQAIAYDGIFGAHLQRQGEQLESDQALGHAMQKILSNAAGAKLPPKIAFRLQSLGWVRFEKQHVLISCELYRRYFSSLMEV